MMLRKLSFVIIASSMLFISYPSPAIPFPSTLREALNTAEVYARRAAAYENSGDYQKAVAENMAIPFLF